MQFIVKYFPEITIKSSPVRKRITQQLARNLKTRFKRALNQPTEIERGWDRLTIQTAGDNPKVAEDIIDILATTPGIAYFARVVSFAFDGLEDLATQAASHWTEAKLEGSFCVRAKRHGKHEFNSTDIERLIGSKVLRQHAGLNVNLKSPEITLRVEVVEQNCFVVQEQQQGLGGFPLGSQESVLSLVSGGFDSTVATYLTMKRGLRTHFLFFNLGGPAHELGVKEVSYFLWRKFGNSHPVTFISVPFDDVVNAILNNIHNSQMGVVLKRMMLRVAEKVAADMHIKALVTGESVAQVASQTLTNLSVIDSVTNTLVLRPLITMDKGDIIDISRQIGTENFSAQIPEYCGVISVKPTTSAKEERVASEEAKFPMELLDHAFERRIVQSITGIEKGLDVDLSVSVVDAIPAKAVVIDIRHPNEVERTPLDVDGAILKLIPFFRLSESFASLDNNTDYLLYCDQGVMSQLHAAHLKESGFTNVGVYRPSS